jgi:hypothetical protein
MKNCAVAEFGSEVRAMAMVPTSFLQPAFTRLAPRSRSARASASA